MTYDEGVGISGESGRNIKTIYPMHECLVREGELTERRMSLICSGLITTTDDELAEARAMEIALHEAYLAKYAHEGNNFPK